MHYMHIKFSCSAHTRSNKSNIIYSIKSFNKRYLIMRRKRSWTILGGLFPPSPDILGGLFPPSPDILEPLALHPLLVGLLCLLLDLLLLSSFLLLPFNVDISSKCLIILSRLLKLFLGYNQFLF
jgi:hypothetical protein